jgi:DNA-binding response OmpR family regulator
LPGTLLIVEADPGQRTIWAAIAEAAGYRAGGLNNPGEVLPELIRRTESGNPVSIIVFSDYGAEEYAELGRQIVARETFGKPALIMLPAVGNPGDARRLMEAGFRGYLVKPVAPADLREALETLRRTPRSLWHRLFLTRHSLAESRQAPKGSSSEGEVRVNSSEPPSVMCMSSSSRTPNSPGI